MYFSIIAYMHIYIYIYITLSLYAFLPGSFIIIIIIISSRCALVKLRCQPTDCQPTATGIYAGVTILEVEVRGEAASKKLPSPKPFGIWFQTLKLKMGCCLVWVSCFRWFFFRVISHVGEVQVNQPSICWGVCQKVVIFLGAPQTTICI